MNNYRNTFGYHNPKKTEKTLLKFNSKCKLKFYDSSYKNDLLDSIEHEIKEDVFLQVYVPNSKKNDGVKDLYNKYLIVKDNDILYKSKKLKKVIKFINDLKL